MKKLIFFFGALALMTTACQSGGGESTTENKDQTDNNRLKEQVIAVHDTAMTKMNEMKRLQKKLEAYGKDSPDSSDYREVWQELEDAHTGMMDWMRNFNVKESWSKTEVYDYLTAEMDKINEVNKAMDHSIARAQKMLAEHADQEEHHHDGDGHDHEDHQHDHP